MKIITYIISAALIATALIIATKCRGRSEEKKINIPNVGEFNASYLKKGGEVWCYLLHRNLNGADVEYVIYPKTDRSRYLAADKDRIAERIKYFDENISKAIQSAPAQVRALCAKYEEPIDSLSDSDIVTSITLENAKMEWDGSYESYCKPGKINRNFDLVIRFDKMMQVIEVYFDG